MIEIRLPKPGPDITEATITKWEVSEGEKIQTGDILAIIKTPIGSFKVAAEEEGILESIQQVKSSQIDFEKPIAMLRPDIGLNEYPGPIQDEDTIPLPIENSEEDDTQVEELEEIQEEAPETESEPEVQEEPEHETEPLVLAAEEEKTPTEETISFVAEPASEDEDIEVSPAARKMAERMDIDLSTIQGTGDNGKILYIDIENKVKELQENEDEEVAPEAEDATDPISSEPSLSLIQETPEETGDDNESSESKSDPETVAESEETPVEAEPMKVPQLQTDPAKAFPDFEEISIQFHLSKKDDLIIPFNSVKKSYADVQSDSNQQVPHFNLFAEVDFTEAKKWRKAYNERTKSAITVTDMMVKACGHALALMPEMNAYVKQDRIILKRSINIGVTTSVDEGVVIPVVPDVYHKSLAKISELIKKNTALAVDSKVVLDYDTTFTISNLGMYGVKRFNPLINPPLTGSLAIGEIQKKVVPVDDFIGIRSVMEVSLACDHRAIDGTTAAKFIKIIREDIENLREEEDPDWIKGNEQMRLI